MSFRDNLRETIDYCGIEQKELAHKANISLRNIENYLRENASIPSADRAVQIAQVLGVTVEYLVTGKKVYKETIAAVDPEMNSLIQNIKKLPKNRRIIVIQNALNLINILSKQK